jgi:hypothetical protein
VSPSHHPETAVTPSGTSSFRHTAGLLVVVNLAARRSDRNAQHTLYMPQLLAWANAEAAGMRVTRVATIVIFRLVWRMMGSFVVGNAQQFGCGELHQ